MWFRRNSPFGAFRGPRCGENTDVHSQPSSEAFSRCGFRIHSLPPRVLLARPILPFQMPLVAPTSVFQLDRRFISASAAVLAGGTMQYTWNQDATLAAVAAQMPNPGTLPQVGPTQGSLPISGGLFGGQIGGNWQVERAVFGIQADAHWADIEGHGSCFDAGAVATAGISFGCNDKVSSFGTITGRVGAALDRALIYAKGGWAWEFTQHNRDLNSAI